MAKIKRKKTKNLKNIFKSKRQNIYSFTFGRVNPKQGKLLVGVISIVFVATAMIVFSFIFKKGETPEVVANGSNKNEALEREINKLVHGYPIEKMTPYIATQDPKTAAFLVSIAKKESNWGKRKPVHDGKDCYNYWGFRLKTDELGSGGHSCFDSPEEAVETVAARIDEMVNKENLDTPKEMVVWKCGYDCQNNPSEQKWIKDVGYYYNKILKYL